MTGDTGLGQSHTPCRHRVCSPYARLPQCHSEQAWQHPGNTPGWCLRTSRDVAYSQDIHMFSMLHKWVSLSESRYSRAYLKWSANGNCHHTITHAFFVRARQNVDKRVS